MTFNPKSVWMHNARNMIQRFMWATEAFEIVDRDQCRHMMAIYPSHLNRVYERFIRRDTGKN